MAGFATYDDIINALSVNAVGERVHWFKSSIGTTASALAYDLWQAAGSPGAGTFGTPLTARAIDNTNAAALQFTNPASLKNKHLLSIGLGSTIALGTLLIYDRLAEYPFTGTITGAQTFSSVTLPARDVAGATSGAGVLPMLESFSATGRTATTVTVGYTNSAGTASRSTAFTNTAGGAVAGSLSNPAGSPFLFPLQAGDVGVRTIQTVAATATLTAANMCITLIRPLAYLPVLAANQWAERDLVLQMPNLPQLFNGTALSFLLLANTTTSPCNGMVVMAEN